MYTDAQKFSLNVWLCCIETSLVGINRWHCFPAEGDPSLSLSLPPSLPLCVAASLSVSFPFPHLLKQNEGAGESLTVTAT